MVLQLNQLRDRIKYLCSSGVNKAIAWSPNYCAEIILIFPLLNNSTAYSNRNKDKKMIEKYLQMNTLTIRTWIIYLRNGTRILSTGKRPSASAFTPHFSRCVWLPVRKVEESHLLCTVCLLYSLRLHIVFSCTADGFVEYSKCVAIQTSWIEKSCMKVKAIQTEINVPLKSAWFIAKDVCFVFRNPNLNY